MVDRLPVRLVRLDLVARRDDHKPTTAQPGAGGEQSNCADNDHTEGEQQTDHAARAFKLASAASAAAMPVS